jgi:hypothetical protein
MQYTVSLKPPCRISKLQAMPPSSRKSILPNAPACLPVSHRLDLQSLFGLYVYRYSLADTRNFPPPPAFGFIYEGANGQPRYTTSLCNPLGNITPAPAVSGLRISIRPRVTLSDPDPVRIRSTGFF